MKAASRIASARQVYKPSRRLATTSAAPPKASQEQIFLGTGVARQGTSLGTEDDWQAALLAQEQSSQPDSGVGTDDVSLFASNRVGQIPLPPRLITSVNEVLSDVQNSSIRTTALRFYESLKLKNEGRTNDTPMPPSKEFTSIEADTYIVGLMPQLYASVHIVLLELRKRLGKDWTPRTVLDCGLGPGTASLAFTEVFITSNPHPASNRPTFTIIQPNHEMRSRTEEIWSTTYPETTKTAKDQVMQIYHKLGATGHKYDVILAPHVLGDVKGRPSDRDDLVRDLHARLNPGGVLLILERGNPLGFEQIARARQLLLRSNTPSSIHGTDESATEGKKSHIIAPCPHDGQCPMYLHGHQPDRRQWCHFSQRLLRPNFLQQLKRGKENVEDVGYSYILLRKSPRPDSRVPQPSSSSSSHSEPSEPSDASDASDAKAQKIGNAGKGGPTAAVEGEGDAAGWDKDIVRASYAWSRIVLPPLKRHKHVLLDVCAAPVTQGTVTRRTSPSAPTTKHKPKKNSKVLEKASASMDQRDGEGGEGGEGGEVEVERPKLQRLTIPKSQGLVEYKFARRAHWGDLLPFLGKTVIEKTELDRDRDGGASRKSRRRRDAAKKVGKEFDFE